MARLHNDFANECDLAKQIKQQVKRDKSAWPDNAIKNGDWKAIKSLRAKRQNLTYCLVNDNLPDQSSAEVLADYFERVQWAVRLVTALPHHTPARALGVNCN